MTEEADALPPKPLQYSDLEWQALHAGAELRRGRQYEDDEPVHEIRWPNGAVSDLCESLPQQGYATGGYVSVPKPDDAPLFPLDGCTYYWPLEPAPAPPGVTVEINTEPPPAGALVEQLRRWVR